MNDKTQPNTPLDLTVHHLPAEQELAAQLDAQSRTRLGRWKMLFVLFLCAAPVVASYLTYYVIRPQHSQFFKVKTFGELIEPQRPIPSVMATTLTGEPVQLEALKGQWLLVSVASGSCLDDCEQRLFIQRQLRETLGAEKDRLDWVWFVTDDAAIPKALEAKLQNYKAPGLSVLRVSPVALQAWLGDSGKLDTQRLYVVDPQGHYMMRFAPNLTPETAMKAKKDVERLLRASSFWDTPGRNPA